MGTKLTAHLDLSGINSLKKKVKALNNRAVEWGFLGGTHTGSGLNFATLASFLEYGGVNNHGYTVPPRPAFGVLINELRASSAAYEMEIGKAFGDYLLGDNASPEVVLKISGEHLVSRHQDTMYNWLSGGTQNTDNSAMTISMKGFNMPFVETGELIQSVSYRTV